MTRVRALGECSNAALAGTTKPRRIALFFWKQKGEEEKRGIGGVAVAGTSNEVPQGNLNGVALAGTTNWVYSGNANGVMVAGVANSIIDKDINGVAVAGLMNQAEGINGFAAALINKCSRVRGAMLGLVNITTSKSAGVQIGLLNIRTDAPWYAKVIPGIAVRFPSFSERDWNKGIHAALEKGGQKALAVRQENRLALARQYAEQNGLLKENGAYRSPDREAVLGRLCEETRTLAAFASEHKMASKERIGKLVQTLKGGSGAEQKDAAGALAHIVSDPEIYGSGAGERALRGLVRASGKHQHAQGALAALGLRAD